MIQKKIIKKYINSGTFFILMAFLFLFLYGLGPNYVDEQGVLHEWFGFIPLAYLSLGLGISIHIVKFVKRHK